MAEIIVNSTNFEEVVLNSPLPVLVDFWAPWCGPCKMLSPIISEVATEYEGKIQVAKIDCDENGELAMKYGISNIPCVKLFKDGKIVDESMGFVPKMRLAQMIDRNL